MKVPPKRRIRLGRRIARVLAWAAAFFAAGCAFVRANFSDDGMTTVCEPSNCPASAGMQCHSATCDRLDGLRYRPIDAGSERED